MEKTRPLFPEEHSMPTQPLFRVQLDATRQFFYALPLRQQLQRAKLTIASASLLVVTMLLLLMPLQNRAYADNGPGQTYAPGSACDVTSMQTLNGNGNGVELGTSYWWLAIRSGTCKSTPKDKGSTAIWGRLECNLKKANDPTISKCPNDTQYSVTIQQGNGTSTHVFDTENQGNQGAVGIHYASDIATLAFQPGYTYKGTVFPSKGQQVTVCGTVGSTTTCASAATDGSGGTATPTGTTTGTPTPPQEDKQIVVHFSHTGLLHPVTILTSRRMSSTMPVWQGMSMVSCTIQTISR